MTEQKNQAMEAISGAVAGKPDAPPARPSQKPWWRRYGVTLSIVVAGVLQASHSYWFVRSNPPPRFEELQTQRIEVLAWQRLHPQLHVRLANGQDRMVEFPTFSLGRRSAYYEISHEQQRQLVGKTCQMWGRPLRFSIQNHYQVFALDCGEDTGLEFKKSIKSYTLNFNSRQSLSSWAIDLFITFFACALFFWAETVRNRKSLSKETAA